MLVKYPGLLQMAFSQVPNLSLRSITLSQEDTLILITFVVKCMNKKTENKILDSRSPTVKIHKIGAQFFEVNCLTPNERYVSRTRLPYFVFVRLGSKIKIRAHILIIKAF